MELPRVTNAAGTRSFALFPAAVLAFIFDSQGRLLLLRKPGRSGAWEVVSGGLEAGETVKEGLLREVHEELGDAVQLKVMGVLHAGSFQYDAVISLISISWLLEYMGGPIVAGDDAAGAEVRWWTREALLRDAPAVRVPREPWLLERAFALRPLVLDLSMELESSSEH